MAEPGFEVAYSEGEEDGDTLIVNLRGEWTFDHASDIERSLAELVASQPAVEFRCASVEAIDLTGAWLLYSKSMELEQDGRSSAFSGFKDVHMKFLSQVIDQPGADDEHDDPETNGALTPVAAVGRGRGGHGLRSWADDHDGV